MPSPQRDFWLPLLISGACTAISVGLERGCLQVFPTALLPTDLWSAGFWVTLLIALGAFARWPPPRRWTGIAIAVAGALLTIGANQFAPYPLVLVVLHGVTFGAIGWTLKSFLTQPVTAAAASEEPEGIHLVHPPSEPEFNVVFVHGIHGHYFKTWSAEENEATYWPGWVAADFPHAAVYSLQYNAYVTAWMGSTMPLFDRAGNLLDMFDNDDIFSRPTVFIVHSYGGLALKKVWRLIKDRKREDAVKAVRAIIFLATPHAGSGMGTFLDFLANDLLAQPTVTAKNLRFSEPELRELNEWYRENPVALNYVYYETVPLPIGIVVDAVSANPSLPGVYPVAITADHLTICKPKNRDAQIAKTVRRQLRDFETLLAAGPIVGPTAPTPKDELGLEIEITRQIGEKVSKFNVQLNDLLVAPSGIAQLLDDYQSEQTSLKWQAVKTRSQANQEQLEDLYSALEALKEISFFGMYPDILNDISRVIDAKMQSFYRKLQEYPVAPIQTDTKVISELCRRAHELDSSNEKVRAIQGKISDYIRENQDDLRKLLVAGPVSQPGKRADEPLKYYLFDRTDGELLEIAAHLAIPQKYLPVRDSASRIAAAMWEFIERDGKQDQLAAFIQHQRDLRGQPRPNVRLTVEETRSEPMDRGPAVPADPETLARTHLASAQKLARTGQYSASIVEFQEALKVDPDNVKILNDLALSRLAVHDVDQGIRDLRQVLRLKPDFAPGHYNLGLAMYHEHKPTEAIAEYRSAIRLQPDYAAAHYNLGLVLDESGQLDEAIEEYEKAIFHDPNLTFGYINLATAQQKKGATEQSMSNYRRAIELSPFSYEAHAGLANLLDDLEQWKPAIGEYRLALQANPESEDCLSNLGRLLVGAGDFDGAITAFSNALKLKPDMVQARNGLGWALFKNDRTDDAIRELEEAIRLDDSNAPAHKNLGEALWKKGLRDAARTEYQKAVSLDPDNVAYQRKLERTD